MTVHPSAIVDPLAKVGGDVHIGAFCQIHGNVEIGDGTHIGSHCNIGHPTPRAEGRPLRVGAGSTIRSHSIFYEGSTFGHGLITGHRVTVREGTVAGAGLHIGSLADIQGDCEIGSHVHMHSNVHICQASVIEDYVWIYPFVVLTNDPHPPSSGPYVGPTLRRFSIVATHACVLPGIEIGEHALVGAAALVTKSVAPRAVVAGVPARQVTTVDEIRLEDGSPAYPWPLNFRRGYPDEVLAAWQEEFASEPTVEH